MRNIILPVTFIFLMLLSIPAHAELDPLEVNNEFEACYNAFSEKDKSTHDSDIRPFCQARANAAVAFVPIEPREDTMLLFVSFVRNDFLFHDITRIAESTKEVTSGKFPDAFMAGFQNANFQTLEAYKLQCWSIKGFIKALPKETKLSNEELAATQELSREVDELLSYIKRTEQYIKAWFSQKQ